MSQERVGWYGLDNAAKIYPAVRSTEISGMFRLTAVMRRQVDADYLQIALEKTLERYPTFTMCIKKGLFWYYLEKNFRAPRVYREDSYPCSKLDTQFSDGYLFRVTYYKRTVNLECFHSLADGTGACAFLKTLVRTYLALAGTGVAPDGSAPSARESEDSFLRYYEKKTAASDRGVSAFHLKMPLLEPYAVAVTHGSMPTEALIELARSHGVTVTAYLSALILYAIYGSPYIGNYSDLSKKPLKVAVPVNLRRWFPSETLRNFAMFVNLPVVTDGGRTTFEEFLAQISEGMKREINYDTLLARFSFNVRAERNWGFKFVPLFIKNFALRASYDMLGEKLYTTMLSNLGEIEVEEDIRPYIERFTFLISPSPKVPVVSTACSFDGTFTLSFNRRAEGSEIEQFVFSYLTAAGVPVTVYTNGGDAT